MKIKQGTIVRVEKSGNRYNAFDSNGTKYTGVITSTTRKHAYQNGNAIEYRANGKLSLIHI